MHAPAFTGADLIFEAAAHSYRLPLSGVAVPSVTQILSALGISTDFEALKGMGGSLADAIERKRAIGTALHSDAHSYDDDDLDRETVHPDVRPYLDAWITFRANQHVFPVTRERRLYSPTLGVCGTLDGIFHRQDAPDTLILVDIKTGDPESAAARYQTALYQILWEEEHPDLPIAERWSVQLTPTVGLGYRIHPYTDWTDGDKARAFVTTYYCTAARRKESR